MDEERIKWSQNAKRRVLAVVFLALISIGATAYLTYQNLKLQEALQHARQTHVNTQEHAFQIQQQLQSRIALLDEELEETAEERNELDEDLEREKDRNKQFEDQIENLTGTVGKLDKLSKTDEELLQKYSKVFFLNEHYRPKRLKEIDDEYVYNEEKDYFIHAEIMPFLEDMIEDAKDDGVEMWVVSAFRTFEEQAEIKEQYTVTYGSGANTFSADQGYSEHQLGTTIDLTAPGMNGALTQAFEDTEAYAWLQENAYEYGFTLSYPRDNQYYLFEPWHWRFVGLELAEHLHDNNLHFYDMEQREINEYLISIFEE